MALVVVLSGSLACGDRSPALMVSASTYRTLLIDAKSSAVPDLCVGQAGRLDHGRLPLGPGVQGFVYLELKGPSQPTAVYVGGRARLIGVVHCNAGGAPLSDHLVMFGGGRSREIPMPIKGLTTIDRISTTGAGSLTVYSQSGAEWDADCCPTLDWRVAYDATSGRARVVAVKKYTVDRALGLVVRDLNRGRDAPSKEISTAAVKTLVQIRRGSGQGPFSRLRCYGGETFLKVPSTVVNKETFENLQTTQFAQRICTLQVGRDQLLIGLWHKGYRDWIAKVRF